MPSIFSPSKYFNVTLSHWGDIIYRKLGARVRVEPKHLLILEVDVGPTTAVGQWNMDCAGCHPRPQSLNTITSGDRLFSINDRKDPAVMLQLIKDFTADRIDSLFLVVERLPVPAPRPTERPNVPPPPPAEPAEPAEPTARLKDYLGTEIFLGHRHGSPLLISRARFNDARFYVSQADCKIVARPATYEDEDDPDEEPRHLVYIALYFTTIYFRIYVTPQVKWAKTDWSHHITLGYVPHTCVSINYMTCSLNGLMRNWFSMKDTEHSRPLNLLTSRTFYIMHEDELDGTNKYDEASAEDFVSANWQDIERAIQQGRLVLRHDPLAIEQHKQRFQTDQVPAELMLKQCRRYYDRDTERYFVAKAVEDNSKPKYNYDDMMEIKLEDGHVSTTTEVASLLLYCRELLKWKFGFSRLHPRKDNTMVLSRWHMTAQTNSIWVNKCKREGQEADITQRQEMYLDFVECTLLHPSI